MNSINETLKKCKKGYLSIYVDFKYHSENLCIPKYSISIGVYYDENNNGKGEWKYFPSLQSALDYITALVSSETTNIEETEKMVMDELSIKLVEGIE